jgi:hypothetical protein
MPTPRLDENSGRPYCKDCDRYMQKRGSLAESGRIRYRCGNCGKSTTGSSDSSYNNQDLGYNPTELTQRATEIRKAVRQGANRFVITAAANNSSVDSNAFKALRKLCKDRKAHLIVIPIHYKNVSLYTANQEYKKWWAEAVRPYLVEEAIRLGPKVWVRGDINIQATAANPLSGMAPLTGDKWCIFGHGQLGLEPIATPLDQMPGRMYTTGAITKKNYSNTKAGAKAAFHHVIGALLVEIQGKNAFIRQLNADSKGNIYDITDCYAPNGITRDVTALSLTTGDEHVKFIADNVMFATYMNDDSLVNVTKPEYIVRHDVLDGYAGSHHHEKDYLKQYKKHYYGDNNYRRELDECIAHLEATSPTDWDCTNILVDSNHHTHLDKWLTRADDRIDHVNADLICELRNMQRQAIRDEKPHGAFQLYLEEHLHGISLVFADPNIPYMLGGVDHSQHGDRGANGARGSARGIANTTHKATIGHTHSARIVQAVYQVGKSTGTLEYEMGLSSHTQTHCLQYPNGKRTLIDILNNNWRAVNAPNSGGVTP